MRPAATAQDEGPAGDRALALGAGLDGAAAGDFFGAGWPLGGRVDETGTIRLVRGDDKLRQSIQLILGTEPGERPMRPEFGCPITQFAFAPIDGTTAGEIAHEVRKALQRWEPRIDVTSVNVLLDADASDTVLMVDIAYVTRATNQPTNLVFPFYTIPGEVQ